MPKLYHCPQYSEAYEQLKFGLPTSSNFNHIITPSGYSSESWMDYACHLIAERCLGRKVDTYQSRDMEHGLMMEADAADFYSSLRKVELQTIGFISNDLGTHGCTPDRLIGDDGLLEIKVPKPQTHIKYLITGTLDIKYKPQLQGQLYVSKRQFVDVLSFHPELPPAIMRVERDQSYIACLDKLLSRFTGYIDKVMDKIGEMTQQTYKKGIPNEQKKISF